MRARFDDELAVGAQRALPPPERVLVELRGRQVLMDGRRDDAQVGQVRPQSLVGLFWKREYSRDPPRSK